MYNGTWHLSCILLWKLIITCLNLIFLFQLKHCTSWLGKYPYIHIFSKICIGLLVLERSGWKKSFWQSISGFFSRYGQKIGSIFSDLFTLGFVALLVYVVYKTCVAAQTGYTANDEYRPTGSGYQPPPPGFRDEYTQRGMN